MSSVAGSFRESLESIAGTIGDVIIIVIIIAVIAFVVKLAGGIQALFGATTTSPGGTPSPGGGQQPGGYQGQQPTSPGIVPTSIIEYLPNQSIWAQNLVGGPLLAVPSYGTLTQGYTATGRSYNPQIYPTTFQNPPPYPVFGPSYTPELPFTLTARNFITKFKTPTPGPQIVYTPITTPTGLQLNPTTAPVVPIYPIGTPGRQ